MVLGKRAILLVLVFIGFFATSAVAKALADKERRGSEESQIGDLRFQTDMAALIERRYNRLHAPFSFGVVLAWMEIKEKLTVRFSSEVAGRE